MSTFRQHIIVSCILLVPCITMAQQDSLMQPHSELFRMQYNQYARESITQPLLKHTNYSSIQLGYRSEEGDYRQAQAPKKQGDILFYTEGSRQIKKFLVSGSFGWQNTQIDSMGYSMRNNHKNPNPYYFYAEKPGNWQTIKYHLQGIVSTPVIDHKLILGAGAKYNSSNSWRTNDPRPQEFGYDLQTNATAHYKITPQHIIGISGGYVRQNNDLDWGYRNQDNVNVSNLKVYLSNGYGNVESLTGMKSGTLSNYTTGYTTEGIYEGNYSFGTITLSGKYQQNKTDIFRKPVEIFEKRVDFGTFNEDIYTASVNWYKTCGRNIFQLQFNYLDEQGKDYNIDLAGINFVTSFEQAQLQGLASRLNDAGKMKYEFGFSAQFRQQLKKDGSVGQHAEYKTGEAALNGAYYFYFPSSNSMLKTALRAGYSHPFHAEAVVVPQQFSFTEGVVYRDYYYFNAKSTSIGGSLTYQFPVKTVNAFIQAGGNLVNASIPDPKDGLIPHTYPGNNRVEWQCSIGVNL